MVIDKRNRMNEGQGQLEKNSDDVHDDDMYQVLKVCVSLQGSRESSLCLLWCPKLRLGPT